MSFKSSLITFKSKEMQFKSNLIFVQVSRVRPRQVSDREQQADAGKRLQAALQFGAHQVTVSFHNIFFLAS